MDPAPRLSPAERRAKREERRAKQREANIGRARKMHLARLESQDSKPAVRATGRPRRSAKPAASPPRQSARRALETHIGCSGWFYWHWRGRFYPDDLPSHRWFEHYASKFKTVELNAPFYAWPTVATVNAWVRQAGRRNMMYTVKVCELITHVKRFSRTAELVQDFGHIGDLLGNRMGCFLFQLPPSFRYSPARLKRIVEQLDPARRNVVEFRHRSWWNPRVYEAFRAAGIIFCSCSGPRLPDELVKTADDLYIRFHGIKQWYRHDYAKHELAVWAQRIRDSGAKRAWIYFNNDRDCNAIKNARELRRQLRRA
jgi:uncharacterized protein YecE (DUF72 family)